MKRGKVLLAVLMIAVLLSGCGKPASNGSDKTTPTATATPAAPANGTATPTPTEEPDVPDLPEGTLLERFVAAAQNTFAQGNLTIDYSITGQLPEQDEKTKSKKICFNKLEDGELVYSNNTYEDGTKDLKYAYLHENGGVYLSSWWADVKMEYFMQQIGKNEGGHMYQVVRSLHESADAAYQSYVSMLAAFFPDWPKTLLPLDGKLLTVFAPLNNDEILTKNFEYHKAEDGSEVLVIRKELIAKVIGYCQNNFKGILYYFGDSGLSILSQIGDFEVTVKFNGNVLDRITVSTVSGSYAKINSEIKFSEIGTTEIVLPKAKAEEFEKAKKNTSVGEPVEDRLDWLLQYETDALEGRVDADVAMVNEYLNYMREVIKDPVINAAVMEAVNGQIELEILLHEGSKFAGTGIELLDEKLKDKYGDTTIKLQSVMWKPLDLYVIFTDYFTKGTAEAYISINP